LESMAKTLSIAVLFLLVLSLLPSCKKCYTCVNSCSVCVLKNSSGAVVAQQTLYSDSLNYVTEKAVLVDSGYTCTASKSTYSINFCVNNKDAVTQYLPYYEGDGRYTCSPN
jgi:ferredoxin